MKSFSENVRSIWRNCFFLKKFSFFGVVVLDFFGKNSEENESFSTSEGKIFKFVARKIGVKGKVWL